MRFIYNLNNWLIDDLEDLMKNVGGWSNINSYKFYKYWLKNISKKKEDRLNNIFENFYNSKDDAVNFSHLN